MEPRKLSGMTNVPGLLFGSPKTGRNPEIWAREWEEQSVLLLGLLEEIDHESLEPASMLLELVRYCLERVGGPPYAELRLLWYQVLNEIWQAAHAALYGDLVLARLHARTARCAARAMQEFLSALAV